MSMFQKYLNKTFDLHRFHLKALKYMTEQDAFEKEIVESVQNICEVLKTRQNTKKDRVVSQENED